MNIRRQTTKLFGLMVLFLIVMTPQLVQGQVEWEMRVCADPNNLPVSNKNQAGFENRILDILANELQAELSYVWTDLDDAPLRTVRDYLQTGKCDLIMGVAEGAAGLLNTVAYYRAPYVFVYRDDAPFEVRSLEDEVLAELRITTFPNSLLHTAVAEYGLGQNVILPEFDTLASTTERTAALIQSVLDGEADVAVVYGPEASYVAQQHPGVLELAPVTPEIAPPLLPMFRIMTIGVRPGDVALRDRLNIALAQRWDDIQAVLDEYGVPHLPVPQPVASAPRQTESVRIGAVLPIPTGNPAMTDIVGRAAQVGALVAEALVGRDAENSDLSVDVLLASSPSADAAFRAAQRLVTTEDVAALIGGFGESQAEALSKVAEERGVLFFNIGSPVGALREACNRYTFHIAASAAMYLDALVGWFSQSDQHRWFIVYEGSSEGKALYHQAVEAVTEGADEATEVGSAAIAPDQLVYYEVLDQIREVAPDVVLLLLEPAAQEFFLSQYDSSELEASITGFPFPIMQTREFLFRLQQVAPEAAGYRATLWDTTLENDGASEVNERFMGRSGEPMDPAGWAAYAAVKIAYEAVVSAGTEENSELVRYLTSPEAVFDVHKGDKVSFRPGNHQLEQPLYLIKIDPEAGWGRSPQDKAAFAKVVGRLPDLYLPDVPPTERLNQLGDDLDEAVCEF